MRIEDYALIGDMQSAALVGRDGSIDWLCLPRFDSPSCFGALLGDEDHGQWWLGPAEGGRRPSDRRRYRGDTLVLENEWDTSGGTVRVIDFMPPRQTNPDLVRIVEGVSGTVDMSTEIHIRFDYGRTVPWVRRTGDLLHAVGGPDSVWLHSPCRCTASGSRTRAPSGSRRASAWRSPSPGTRPTRIAPSRSTPSSS
nr:hypothetical protein GCM10020093_027950 [Planobispora longispora]